MSNPKAFVVDNADGDHKSLVFFSYDDLSDKDSRDIETQPPDPVIPGSELRGMIRGVYEALTDSCLTMDYGAKIYKRSQNYKKPGVVVWDGKKYVLYEAYNILQPHSKLNNFKTGDIVNFLACNTSKNNYARYKIKGNLKYGSLNGLLDMKQHYKDRIHNGLYSLTGVILIGEYMKTKEKQEKSNNGRPPDINEHIFVCKEKLKDTSEKIEEAISRLKLILDYYRDAKINKNLESETEWERHTGYKDYTLDVTKPLPVWWEKDTAGNIYFSPASRGKDVPINNWNNIVKKQGYLPCDDYSRLCPACSLFGTTETYIVPNVENTKPTQKSVSSRIRFTDAKFTGRKPMYNGKYTLAELSGPKSNAVEFYTNFNGYLDKVWNLDFIYNKKEPEYINDLYINGRKVYLNHIPTYKDHTGNDPAPTERNCTVIPIKGCDENKFSFKVYFDRISETELKRLLVILSCGKNGGDLMHKLGHGKPLGLGSVRICVDGVFMRDINRYLIGGGLHDSTEKYRKYWIDDYFGVNNANDLQNTPCEDIFGTDKKVIDSFKLLFSWSSFKDMKVSYPLAYDETENDSDKKSAIYNWFTFSRNPSKPNQPSVALPIAQNANGNPEKLKQNKLIKKKKCD